MHLRVKMSMLKSLLFRGRKQYQSYRKECWLVDEKDVESCEPNSGPINLVDKDGNLRGKYITEMLFKVLYLSPNIQSTTRSDNLVLKTIISTMNITFIVWCSVSLSMSISKSKDRGDCDWNKIKEVINI